MQKFSFDEICSILAEVKNENKLISSILKSADNISSEEIKKIGELYNSKAEKIGQIRNWLNSDEGKIVLDKRLDEWNSLINPVLKIEEENIKQLGIKAASIAEKIKLISKQKSLLIYTKS
jgi:hypothetical protein